MVCAVFDFFFSRAVFSNLEGLLKPNTGVYSTGFDSVDVAGVGQSSHASRRFSGDAASADPGTTCCELHP